MAIEIQPQGKITPLMRQYWEIKAEHMDKVLLFRMGDFFEMFHGDAETAAPILNIALTARNKKAQDETKMCGVPHHSIAGPIAKLLSAGHKVAICDQVEDPKEAKGIVKRAVTRILSPGMVFDPDTLDELQANYLASYDDRSVAFLDASTGEAFYYAISHPSECEKLLLILQPVELVLSQEQKQAMRKASGFANSHVTGFDMKVTNADAEKTCLPISAQRLLDYVSYMQGGTSLNFVFEERRLKRTMEISSTVLRHLEVFTTYKGEAKGSLFYAINRTCSSAGARLLKNWLRFPLTDLPLIEERQKKVEYWVTQLEKLKHLRQALSRLGDVERRLAKVGNPNGNARDLVSLADSLRVGLEISQLDPFFSRDRECLDYCRRLLLKIDATLVEEPPLSTKEGGMIRQGVSEDLDELIRLSEDSQSLLIDLETREKERTGIPSLKVRYNSVFGYYIEVTKTHTFKVPSHYMRKQTLTNAERYTTDELNSIEEKVISARSRRADMEFEFFSELRQDVLAARGELLQAARLWSELDVVTSLAWLAIEGNYCKPHFSQARALQAPALHLVASRHPVVEQEVAKAFVPNDIKLGASECLLLTGPNMAGKSTLMRQVAVTVLLAQIGAFVPAREATLPIFNKLFTRIGASDHLSEGLSTFMVEMQETAEMLKQTDENSLVILDEVGRGTSTYDGMSLAQAILECLVGQKRSMTLFATHYHELTRLDSFYPQVHNAHMSIVEKTKGREIQFLHTLTPGPANRSYGIHVARLAGLPDSVTRRAQGLLAQMESFQGSSQMSLLNTPIQSSDVGPLIEEEIAHPLLAQIKEVSLQEMTPLEAINQIAKWQQSLS